MWLWGGVWAHIGGAGDCQVSGPSVRNEAFLCVCTVWGGAGPETWDRRERGVGELGGAPLPPSGHCGHFSLLSISWSHLAPSESQAGLELFPFS